MFEISFEICFEFNSSNLLIHITFWFSFRIFLIEIIYFPIFGCQLQIFITNEVSQLREQFQILEKL